MDPQILKAVFKCDRCGMQIITVNEQERGFMSGRLDCRATSDCPGTMRPVYIGFDRSLVPSWKWVRQRLVPRHPRDVRKYFRRGGLALRPIKARCSAG